MPRGHVTHAKSTHDPLSLSQRHVMLCSRLGLLALYQISAQIAETRFHLFKHNGRTAPHPKSAHIIQGSNPQTKCFTQLHFQKQPTVPTMPIPCGSLVSRKQEILLCLTSSVTQVMIVSQGSEAEIDQLI